MLCDLWPLPLQEVFLPDETFPVLKTERHTSCDVYNQPNNTVHQSSCSSQAGHSQGRLLEHTSLALQMFPGTAYTASLSVPGHASMPTFAVVASSASACFSTGLGTGLGRLTSSMYANSRFAITAARNRSMQVCCQQMPKWVCLVWHSGFSPWAATFRSNRASSR